MKKRALLSLSIAITLLHAISSFAIDMDKYDQVDSITPIEETITIGSSTDVYRVTPGHRYPLNGAGWRWLNGYCYYYSDRNQVYPLKNTITPDGYTVDEFGRWTENGVPVYNGYGSQLFHADELYAGKTNEEIKDIMFNKMEEVFSNTMEYSNYDVACVVGPNRFYDYGNTALQIECIYDSMCDARTWDRNHTFSMEIRNNCWYDGRNNLADRKNEKLEAALKLYLGDRAGQEFFDEIRAAGDQKTKINPSAFIPRFDDEGRFVKNPSDHRRVDMIGLPIELIGDGLDCSLLNLDHWNGRLTDYGKVITIEWFIASEFSIQHDPFFYIHLNDY